MVCIRLKKVRNGKALNHNYSVCYLMPLSYGSIHEIQIFSQDLDKLKDISDLLN